MNLVETLQLLDKLAATGVTYFKSNDFVIELRGPMNVANDANKAISLAPQPTPKPSEQYSESNTKKVQDLIDLLKSKDEELVNQIFPEGA